MEEKELYEKANKTRSQLRDIVDKAYDIIDQNMPYQGDKCVDSQKVCLIIKLNEFYSCIEGITKDDFKILENNE